jgi:alkanesulfonate monooxygenase SsuD/methylene tetrahydromethanopterin reductase-like flavin-dependent oxidoreductase (luciferase family)
MKVGITLFAQNYTDWDRYQSGAFDRKPMMHDSQAYDEEMQLGDLCEPLGFDSLWTVEHHFTPYTMVPDPLQMLTYFAGRTQKIDFGTMVIVLPWHDPVQTAEKIAMLDNMLRGRKLTLGFGRGAGRVEFESLRIPMGESRERFLEALAVVRAALTNERFSFEGKHYQIPETSVRPQPRSADLTDRMYCAWGTPSSMPMAANSGLGALFIPQKSWAEYAEDMKGFNEVRSQNGWGPMKPVVAVWIYCHENEQQAWDDAVEYMGNYSDSARRHYEFDDPQHFKETKGYEHYAQMSEAAMSIDRDVARKGFAMSQVWGTPEMCVAKLKEIRDLVDAEEFVLVFKYGAIPQEKAVASMRLFAEKALKEVQGLGAVVAAG